MPSGSSLSSQDEGLSLPPTRSISVSNGPTLNSEITAELLDRWKQDILAEVRREISKAKNEIIEGMC